MKPKYEKVLGETRASRVNMLIDEVTEKFLKDFSCRRTLGQEYHRRALKAIFDHGFEVGIAHKNRMKPAR